MTIEFKGPCGTIFLRDVPRNVRDPFHAACAFRGKTMKQVFLEFMQDYARETSKVKKRDVALSLTRSKNQRKKKK